MTDICTSAGKRSRSSNYKLFFSFVIPSILAFALSGVYAIVDGFFVGNSVGDIGISTINVAYPIIALILAVGTGIGMGGAVYFSIFQAEGKPKEAGEFVAGTLWLLLAASIVMTALVLLLATPLLKLLGAQGDLLTLGQDYIYIMALGSVLQLFGSGLIPLIRNNGGAIFAMITMCSGFLTNIILDYLFVWVFHLGVSGAAWATIIGEGVAMAGGVGYLLYKKQMHFAISREAMKRVTKSIVRIGLAPFGLALTPNFSLILINRFSASYGGEPAIAVYACVSYILTIVYLVLQGVGDGIQPLMSQFYGSAAGQCICLRLCPAAVLPQYRIIICIPRQHRRHLRRLRRSHTGSGRDTAHLPHCHPVYRRQPGDHSQLLRHRKKYLRLHAYLHRTGRHAGVHADSAPALWRSDHDLVERHLRENRLSSAGSDPKMVCKKTIIYLNILVLFHLPKWYNTIN